MRALTFRGRRDVACTDVADPRLERSTDALVRVELTAICGSDLHVYHERERGIDPGTVMGHEFVGTVLETGRDVERIRPGDPVLSPFTTSCGDCAACRGLLSARCERGQLFGWVEQGRGLHGAQAEVVRVPLADGTLRRIPRGLDGDRALLLGDVLSTGYFCARQAEIRPDGVYVVLGCGPVGLMAILAARALGAETVYAVDGIAERLELARGFGARPIDLEGGDARAAVLEGTDGRGADAVLEAVGSPASSRLAIELVRPGGTLSIVGVHNEPHFSFSPTEAYDRNLTLRIGRCPVGSLLAETLPLAQSERLDPTAIITHRLPLEEGPEGYRIFDEKREGCVKIVMRP